MNESISYTVFTYQCGDLFLGHAAAIGYFIDHNRNAHHEYSLTNMSSMIACLNMPWTNIIYRLSGRLYKYNLTCLGFFHA